MTRVRLLRIAAASLIGLAAGLSSVASPAQATPQKISDKALKQAVLTNDEVKGALGAALEAWTAHLPEPWASCSSGVCQLSWTVGAGPLDTGLRRFATAKEAKAAFKEFQSDRPVEQKTFQAKTPSKVIYVQPAHGPTLATGVQLRGSLLRFVHCQGPADGAAQAAQCVAQILAAQDAKARKLLGT